MADCQPETYGHLVWAFGNAFAHARGNIDVSGRRKCSLQAEVDQTRRVVCSVIPKEAFQTAHACRSRRLLGYNYVSHSESAYHRHAILKKLSHFHLNVTIHFKVVSQYGPRYV